MGGVDDGDRTTADGDRALVARLRRGEAAAFDVVYAALAPRVHRFLLRLSARHDVAEDLAQETWLRFARSASTLSEDTRLAPWLFTIARNAFVSHRRWAMLDLSRLVTLGAGLVSADLAASAGEGPDEAHARARTMAALERALAKVPVAAREVLLLVGVEGLAHEEAAAVLGVTGPTLRQRLKRARDLLAEKLAEQEELEGRRTRALGRRAGETP